MSCRSKYYFFAFVVGPVGFLAIGLAGILFGVGVVLIGGVLWAIYVTSSGFGIKCPSCDFRIAFRKVTIGMNFYIPAIIIPKNCLNCGNDLTEKGC